MRKRSLIMAGLAVLTFFASTRVAKAQDMIIANVPFDFVVGDVKLPAGEYAVKAAGPNNAVLMISRTDATQSVFVCANSAAGSDIQTESKLVFDRYGDSYFLHQIWTAGSSRGKQLMKTNREKEAALIARNTDQSQVVLVASLSK